MSVQDLKRGIEASSEEDKLFLLAFLAAHYPPR